jgi:hypothetical protein
MGAVKDGGLVDGVEIFDNGRMSALAALALACLASAPARADLLDGACFNEVSLLCPGRGQAATLRCLRENEDGLMSDCRQALSAQRRKEEMAREAAAAESLKNLPPIPTTLAPAPVLRVAWLSDALGAVFVHLAGRPEDQVVPATSGAALSEGDTVVVGDGGSAELSLDGATVVALSSGTELALTSLSRAETELGLALGEISAKVAKLADGENLRVRTPAAVAAVRGTELLVAQDSADGPSRVGVVDEGRVEVDSGGKAVLLGPRQETSASAGRAPELPHPLSSLRARAEAFGALRARADRARQLNPPAEAVRHVERERLAGRAPRARFGIVRRRASAAPAPARPAARAHPAPRRVDGR